MKKLCSTCLTELAKNEQECPVCGTKQKRSYKKALRISAFVIIPIFLIILIFAYIHNTQSATAIQEKFADALANRDYKALQKLVIHEDSSDITSTEAKAITKLIEDMGEVTVEKFFFPIKTNGFLSLHKMTAKTVSVASIKEPLQLEIKGSDNQKLVPGKYNVTISFEDVLKSKKTEAVVVTKKETNINEDIRFRHVDVHTEISFPITTFHDVSIKMNGQTNSLEELSKKQSMQVFNYLVTPYSIQVKLPWGNVVKKSTLVNSIDVTNIPLLSKKHQKNIEKLLHTTIQNMQKGMVDKDVFTNDMKDRLPTFIEADSSPYKISYIEENHLLVSNNLEAAGVSITFYTSQDEALYAHLIYEKAKDDWKIDFLTGEIFEPSTLDEMDLQSIDPSYAPIDITNFSAAQLNFYFKSEYFFQLQLAAYPEFSSKNDVPKTYDYLSACDKALYSETFVKKVELLEDNLAKIHSIDTCSTGDIFEATSVLKREGTSNWQFKELEPRKLIKQP